MAKIEGKYKSVIAEELLEIIKKEDSITKLHYLIQKYLHLRYKQIEKIIANIDDTELDLEFVVEQLWEDLELVLNHYSQIDRIMNRSGLDRTMNRGGLQAQSFELLKPKIRL